MEERLLALRTAECIGLWLAEGDNKTNSEITFTNNCWELIDLFYKTIDKLFCNYKYNPRIYVYSSDNSKPKTPYKNYTVKYYLHKRATKPYFIFRVASVEMVKEWKELVRKFLASKEHSANILRGFFAGEGNVHVSSHKNRVLRIAQGIKKPFIDNLLKKLGISFYFEPSHRQYIIHGKPNWDIFANFRLADLHPDKKKKFWDNYNFQQEHYGKFYLIKNIFSTLEKPFTAQQLSNKFNRSFARIQDVLIDLKKRGKTHNFRIGNVDYWTKDKNLIIISKLKKKYLFLLNISGRTSEMAKKFGVCWKSSFNRLKELEKLNLVRRQKDGRWIKTETKKKILVI